MKARHREKTSYTQVLSQTSDRIQELSTYVCYRTSSIHL